MKIEHMTWPMLIIEGIIVVVILYKILSARKGKNLFIRRIPGLNALDEAVGRATEMGRPMLFNQGLYGLDILTIQAVAIGSYIAKLAAKYGTKLIFPVYDPQMMPITEEVIKEAYNAEGRPDAFNPADIRFLSNDQFAFATGVVGILNREKVAAHFMFGYYYAEALIMAEEGHQVGAIQIAGTPAITQVPFLVASCDYTIIGDEFYAATAYLTRQPTLLGSLVGQDYGKLAIIGIILLGVGFATFSALHGIDKNVLSNVINQNGGITLKDLHTFFRAFGR